MKKMRVPSNEIQSCSPLSCLSSGSVHLSHVNPWPSYFLCLEMHPQLSLGPEKERQGAGRVVRAMI